MEYNLNNVSYFYIFCLKVLWSLVILEVIWVPEKSCSALWPFHIS